MTYKINFNYDCVLDYSLKQKGNNKWDPHYGYGFNLGSGGRAVEGYHFWQPQEPASRENTATFLKLHGSLHFVVSNKGSKTKVKFKERPYTKQGGTQLKFEIIPPEWHKEFDKGVFGKLWERAGKEINHSTHIIMIGYSLPLTDLHSTALFQTSVKKDALKSLVLVNPDQLARKRARTVLQRGLTKDTRIFSFDYFDEFLAADRNMWEV
jgi:hypothetical protein